MRKLVLVIGISLFFLQAKSQCSAGQEEVTIEITTDDFGSETSWELYNLSGGLVASGGPYGSNQSYTSVVCVDTSDCFRFVIYDSFGDGMCCFYGLGSYTVYYGPDIMGTGGAFANSSTIYGIGNCASTSPLETDHSTYTPTQLVTDVLLGSCVEAFNITYQGAPAAVGYFSNGSSMGMESGLLLTTGNTDIGPGPNNNSAAGYVPGTPGDPILEAVTGYSPTLNAASLEFDFISFNDTVSFRYIFASEEYNEFVCSGYNDVFAFLVSGPGYAPNTNIAVVPGTAVPVAINTVNNGTPGDFLGAPYDCSILTTPNNLTNTAYFVDNTGGLVTQFDGYTVPLTATMVVVPCDTYHIKLVIADVGDELYDSGVLLEAESFTAGASIGIEATTLSGTKDAFEGCSDGTFTFFREDTSNMTNPVTINFTLSGTATEGADFQAIPRLVTIAANQYSATVNVVTVLDGIVEAPEQVILSYQDICTCNLFKRDTLFINDNLVLDAAITGPPIICQGQQAIVTAAGSGSLQVPYSYSWSTGDTADAITVSPLVTTSYTVTVTDFCAGQTVSESFLLDVAPAVIADFTYVTPQCRSQAGVDFMNTSIYTGVPTFYWDLGDATLETTENITGHIYSLADSFDVLMRITVNGCSDSITQTMVVTSPVSTNISATICPDSLILAGGALQNTTGIYYDTLTAANGCDSVVITDLTVLPFIYVSQPAMICEGDSIYLKGAFQYIGGNYVDTVSAISGCDTILTTNLTVLDTSITNISASICDGDSFYAGGAWQINPGIYYDSLLNANSCDSIIVTDLSVRIINSGSVNVSICEGDSFLAGGTQQTVSGSYIDILVGSNGCDSILTTNLTVHDTSIINIAAEICDGDSFFAGGAWQVNPGVYYDTLLNANNCDSIVITDLSLLIINSGSINVSICEGESFLAGGALQTVSGSYIDILVGSNGCDSILTTNLTVLNTSITNVAAAICDGDSFFAGGAWQTNPGVYYDTLLNANSCDSIVITDLSLLIINSGSVNVNICEGESFFASGALQTVSGSYIDVLVGSNGCDSILTTNLTVLDTNITNVAAAICDGDSFFTGGAWQNNPGVYYDTLLNANNCDSIVVTDLSLLIINSGTVTVNICEGDSFFAGGAYQTVSGRYIDILVGDNGCDSTLTTNLAVFDTSITNIVTAICDGDSLYAGGGWQSNPGVYSDTLLNTNNCDSIVVTNLTLLSIKTGTVSTSICEGDSLFVGGTFQKITGSYIDILNGSNGCDSIVTTNLTVFDTSIINVAVTICAGDSFYAEGAWQSQTGVYVDQLFATSGCDSTVITDLNVISISVDAGSNVGICDGDFTQLSATGGLTYSWSPVDGLDFPDIANPTANPTVTTTYLVTGQSTEGCTATDSVKVTVSPNYAENVSIAICQGATHTLPDGTTVNTGGVYPVILSTADGCDSVIITDVSVITTIPVQNDVTICRGDSYFAEGVLRMDPGIYVDTFPSSGGCDSIVTTNLAVADTFRITLTSSICEGDSIFVGGGWQTLAGTYYDFLSTPSGCDSTIVTTLSVIAAINTQWNPSICDGDSVFAGGAFQKTMGVYKDTFALINGCDSIQTTNLTVRNSYTIDNYERICEGDSFFAEGAWQKNTGDYFDYFTSASNCDSLIITHLTVDTTALTSIRVNICPGESYFAGGAQQTTDGVYLDTFPSVLNCDSIVTTTLTVLDTFITYPVVEICEGDSFFVGRAWQKVGGTYADTLNSSNGCDSIVNTNLSVLAVISTRIDTTICEGESFFAHGIWQTETGVYVDTAQATGGCDSINTTYLTVIEINLLSDTSIICPGGEMTLFASGIFDSYLWQPGGETTSSILVTPGSYQLIVTDTNNCSASANFLINEADSIALEALSYFQTILEGESVSLQVINSPNVVISSYVWSPSTGLSCDSCSETVATPNDDIIYTVTATDSIGCMETVIIEVIVDTLLKPLIYIPNAFSPNGDAVNDEFNIYGQGFEDFRLRIFDRWGELLFESYDQSTGWDGTFRGKLCNPGVYVYVVDASFIRNERLSEYTTYRKGSVTLLR